MSQNSIVCFANNLLLHELDNISSFSDRVTLPGIHTFFIKQFFLVFLQQIGMRLVGGTCYNMLWHQQSEGNRSLVWKPLTRYAFFYRIILPKLVLTNGLLHCLGHCLPCNVGNNNVLLLVYTISMIEHSIKRSCKYYKALTYGSL